MVIKNGKAAKSKKVVTDFQPFEKKEPVQSSFNFQKHPAAANTAGSKKSFGCNNDATKAPPTPVDGVSSTAAVFGKKKEESKVQFSTRNNIHSLAKAGNVAALEEMFKADDSAATVNIDAVSGFSNDTALGIASSKGHTDVVELLLLHGAAVNGMGARARTPLHSAVISGHELTAKLLIKHGANLEAHDAQQETPLHSAIKAAVEHDDTTIVELLINMGANVDAHGHWGTPLHRAGEDGRCDIVELLMSHGADANLRSKFSIFTPAESAASVREYEVLELMLMLGGVDAHLCNQVPWAILEELAVCGMGHKVELLMSLVAEPVV